MTPEEIGREFEKDVLEHDYCIGENRARLLLARCGIPVDPHCSKCGEKGSYETCCGRPPSSGPAPPPNLGEMVVKAWGKATAERGPFDPFYDPLLFDRFKM